MLARNLPAAVPALGPGIALTLFTFNNFHMVTRAQSGSGQILCPIYIRLGLGSITQHAPAAAMDASGLFDWFTLSFNLYDTGARSGAVAGQSRDLLMKYPKSGDR